MEKDVIVEFTRQMALGAVKLIAYCAVIALVSYGWTLFGVAPDESVLYGATTVVGVMFVWFSVEMAWTRAKRKVDFRNKYGKELEL